MSLCQLFSFFRLRVIDSLQSLWCTYWPQGKKLHPLWSRGSGVHAKYEEDLWQRFIIFARTSRFSILPRDEKNSNTKCKPKPNFWIYAPRYHFAEKGHKQCSIEAIQFVEEYQKSKIINSDDEKKSFDKILEFWKTKASSMKPIEKVASKLAEYYLSPPATSVDVERQCSTAGDIRTQERNRLLPENAGKILFLKENLPRIDFDY